MFFFIAFMVTMNQRTTTTMKRTVNGIAIIAAIAITAPAWSQTPTAPPQPQSAGTTRAKQMHHHVRHRGHHHMAHHRGQLTVYLRLNEEKVPAIYGPSADEGK